MKKILLFVLCLSVVGFIMLFFEGKKQDAWVEEIARSTEKEEDNFESAMKKALAGDSAAQRYVAFCFRYGRGVAKNEATSICWFEKAANQGDAEAEFELAERYYRGMGPRDVKKAFSLYKSSSEKGFAKAQYRLGYLMMKSDLCAAIVWLKKAAGQGNVDAMNFLGSCYEHRKELLNYNEAVKWYKKSAIRNNPEGQYRLGRCYYDGKVVEKNHQEAFKWFQRAELNRDSLGMLTRHLRNYLGKCYLEGNGVAQDSNKAFQYFNSAVPAMDSCYYLGVCYLNGVGVSKDPEKAVKWLEREVMRAEGAHPLAKQAMARAKEALAFAKKETEPQ